MKWHFLMAAILISLMSGCGGGDSGGGSNTTAGISDQEAVTSDSEAITFDAIRGDNTLPESIVADLSLDSTGENGSIIYWSSTDLTRIMTTGTVYQPPYYDTSKNVTLTARIVKGSYEETKSFDLTVLPADATDDQAVAATIAMLDFTVIAGANTDQEAIGSDLTLDTAGLYGAVIVWSSSDTTLVATDGTVNLPSYLEGDLNVTLTATVSRGISSSEESFDLILARLPATTDEQTVLDTVDMIGFDDIKNANTYANSIASDLTLPLIFNGASLSWSSSDTTRITSSGSVTRATYTEGDVDVNLTAAISSGTVTLEKRFALTVAKLPATDTEAIDEANAGMSFDAIGGDNHDADNIVFKLHLPTADANGVAFAWTSSDTALVTIDGNITRPSLGSADATVELNVTATRGTASFAKSFALTLLAERREVALSHDGRDTDVFMVEPMNGSDFNVTLDLGTATKDVYFVITNTNDVDETVHPSVTALNVSDYQASKQLASFFPYTTSRSVSNIVGRPFSEPPVSGDPKVTAFNAKPKELTASRPSSSGLNLNKSIAFSPQVQASSVGDMTLFKDQDGNLVFSTMKKIVNEDNRTLNVWVANDVYGSCNKANCVTDSMIDELAESFLKAGDDNDIYEWVTGIYGEEWGAHGYGNLIAPDGNITILLMDIDADNSTNGGTLGFFYSRDNFIATSDGSGTDDSNERIMFYIDAVLFAEKEGTTWERSDYWPSNLISTLAHEFQHMIHFYQKNVLHNGTAPSTDTWVNEMCSLVTEDLVASKLQVDGPRGVAYNDGTAGSSGNNKGRLLRYNYFNYVPLTTWFTSTTTSGEENVLNSYSVAYAFGSYIARNYGGAELFRDIVQSDYGDERAIADAMTQMGYDENLSTLLPKWGAANLLSGTTAASAKYRYNSGGYIDSTLGGITYRLGSINLFYYSQQPYVPTSIDTSLYPGTYKHSNLLLEVGTGLSGSIKRAVSLRPGYQLTVVVK